MKRKMHYAWVVLIGCCLMQGGTLGTILNSSGVYYVAVCEELGFPVAQMTLYRTFSGITAMLSMPMVSRIFNRYDSRIVLTVAAILFICPTMAMSQFQHVTQWHIAGMVQGLGSNLLTILAPPVLLSNWFKEKTGLAIGIASSFSGLMGAISNTVISNVVQTHGWRTGYAANAILAFSLVLPATIFILRFRPEEKNLKAYGEGDSTDNRIRSQAREEEYSDREMKQRAAMVMVLALGVSIGAGFVHLLNAYGVSIGMAATAAALLASVSLLGNTVFKLFLGVMNDRVGTRWSAMMAYVIGAIGCITLICFRAPLIYLSAVLFGLVAAAYTTLTSLVTQAALGQKGFAQFYPKVSMVIAMLASLMGTVHGWIFDTTGAYTVSLLLCAAGLGVSALMTLLLFYRKKK